MRDLAFWLGEIRIARHPEYRWALQTGGLVQDVFYQSTVLALDPVVHEGPAEDPFPFTWSTAWQAASKHPILQDGLTDWGDFVSETEVHMWEKYKRYRDR
ncbi:hypothetical protein DW322_05035 [Rhodococcus rhodnii]|uniref:Uncharacterized protein n=2 Tax=Rhodococcus rhodnii TaxID=38312 RepID=R7WHA6_9NOCA|nr:hypothetical protein [Rhodococcus rhodnii]EOM74540.1 hypothetical protein Rrhod_4129 [Rhodococcus rhodnii LMG 5362]TXG89698.1 hypothetical protein DW322_05035 [Rhodococcus rhodnii]